MDTVLTFFDEQQHVFHLIQRQEAFLITGSETNFPWQIVRDRSLEIVHDIFRRGQKEGAFRIRYSDTAALMLLGGLHSVIRFAQPPRLPNLAEQIVDNFLDGANAGIACPLKTLRAQIEPESGKSRDTAIRRVRFGASVQHLDHVGGSPLTRPRRGHALPQFRQLGAHRRICRRVVQPRQHLLRDGRRLAVVGQILGKHFLLGQQVDQADEPTRLELLAHPQIELADAVEHCRRLTVIQQFQPNRARHGDGGLGSMQ